MNIAKFQTADGVVRIGIVKPTSDPDRPSVIPLQLQGSGFSGLTDLLDAEHPIAAISQMGTDPPLDGQQVIWLPPIDEQEIWAAGVTYKRSQTARMEESEAAASCYDRVYLADRPELFFKATPHRTRGHLGELRIRKDSHWNVPEPEVALVMNRQMKIVGLTIGNDMSSRDIEGENPLYLPQAKCYDACAGLGPWIRLLEGPPKRSELGVRLEIRRGDKVVFDATTSAAEMAREFEDLVQWMQRDNVFPGGAVLMTGTGVVPDSDFTLAPGDVVHISIDTIGTLTNTIIQAN